MERTNERHTRRAMVRGSAAVSPTGLVVLAAPVPSLDWRTKDKDCKDFNTQKQAQQSGSSMASGARPCGRRLSAPSSLQLPSWPASAC
jgi:hypothetical protein